MSERTETVILELSEWDERPFRVERHRNGYRWETVAAFATKVAAFTRAESVREQTGDSVRVLKVGPSA